MTDTPTPDDQRPDWPDSEPEIGWEQFGRNWQDTARHYATNADYWKAEVERLRAELRRAVDLLSEASHHVTEDSGLDRRLYAALSGPNSLRVVLADAARSTPDDNTRQRLYDVGAEYVRNWQQRGGFRP